MCSIYGGVSINYKKVASLFSHELQHRGPDGSGVYYDDVKCLVLGHNRLSIIDLSNSAVQPMVDESGRYVIVFNGEIYNYLDIKRQLIILGYTFFTNSDTEVLLKSYIEWGSDCVKKIRGMFAFCIYNKNENYLFLARDRFGIKPLIYTFLEGQFFFSSELKPFLNSELICKKLSVESISEYFKFGSVKQPNTILEGVYQLMPGHTMTVKFDDLGYDVTRYYDYVEESKKLSKITNYNEAIIRVREEFEHAIRYHMVADVEVGAFLSAGVDSTSVVALMRSYSNKQVNTFSVGFKNKVNITDETDIASKTAKKFGCYHHNIMIDDQYIIDIFDNFISSIDQPSIDGINSYIVSLEAAKEVKVALSGLGGDEIFSGYPHFKTINKYSNKKNDFIYFFAKKLYQNRYTQKYNFVGVDEERCLEEIRTINNNAENFLLNNFSIEHYPLSPYLSSLQRISKLEIDRYMLNTLLRDNDVMSMAHSLEVRPVLLDHKLVELAFSLDDRFKLQNGILKSVFVDSMKDLIPVDVWKRKKTGFEMPYAIWMNGILNSYFKTVVNNKSALMIFSLDYLLALKKRVATRKLKINDWGVFIFLCWLDKFSIEISS
ncbi:asparagine synthase (glutamine-hydrolyzing) [Shewanella dokdonensis]|nr:asparagine synthase (glutamine-hydrolyzing) [Shewanella dokdonensis]MCL1073881.1 asparagine synthase (glutamine-hydrolyzing) [Shewanella dokdonensis]